MKNDRPLFTKFAITETSIELTDDKITKEDFLDAAIQYVTWAARSLDKKGDLIRRFQELFGDETQTYLIPKLAKATNTAKKTYENYLSIAKSSPANERSYKMSASHQAELQSLRNQAACAKLTNMLIARKRAGGNIPLLEWRQLIRDEKKRTGQRITKGRRNDRTVA